MKILLVGYGRMGQEVEKVAKGRGHEIVGVYCIEDPLQESSSDHGAEVVIDFSSHDVVLPLLKFAAARGLPVIEGTTGWNADLEKAARIPGVTLLYSPNFSLGVYHFISLAREAARRLGKLAAYDTYVHEWHHSGKVDSPSGTALRIGEVLLNELPSKDRLQTESCHQKIEPSELHVTSSRVGRIPGTHEVGFDSEFDSITFRHVAHGREGFAFGAVRAAEWIVGRTGIFTMDDFVASLTAGEAE